MEPSRSAARLTCVRFSALVPLVASGLLILGGCTNEESSSRAIPSPSESATVEARKAPAGFQAFVTETSTRGTVLTVRTVGSSSCPFEVGQVEVVNGVVEVSEKAGQNTARPCTADAGSSSDEFTVEPNDASALLAAESVLLTTSGGDRYSLALRLGGVE